MHADEHIQHLLMIHTHTASRQCCLLHLCPCKYPHCTGNTIKVQLPWKGEHLFQYRTGLLYCQLLMYTANKQLPWQQRQLLPYVPFDVRWHTSGCASLEIQVHKYAQTSYHGNNYSSFHACHSTKAINEYLCTDMSMEGSLVPCKNSNKRDQYTYLQ